MTDSDPRLEVLTELVRSRQSYLKKSKGSDRAYNRLMRRLARRRGSEAQALVSGLMSSVSTTEIARAVEVGIGTQSSDSPIDFHVIANHDSHGPLSR